MIDFSVAEEGKTSVVTTKLMVKLQLNLPWKPVLAWPWGVRHVLDQTTFQQVLHQESWDVSAAQGVAQLFRPGSTVLRNRLGGDNR